MNFSFQKSNERLTLTLVPPAVLSKQTQEMERSLFARGEMDTDYYLQNSQASHDLRAAIKKYDCPQTTISLFKRLLEVASSRERYASCYGVLSPCKFRNKLTRRRVDCTNVDFNLIPDRINLEIFMQEICLVYHEWFKNSF